MDHENYKNIAKNLLCYKFKKLKFNEQDFLNSVILSAIIDREMIAEIKRINKKCIERGRK